MLVIITATVFPIVAMVVVPGNPMTTTAAPTVAAAAIATKPPPVRRLQRWCRRRPLVLPPTATSSARTAAAKSASRFQCDAGARRTASKSCRPPVLSILRLHASTMYYVKYLVLTRLWGGIGVAERHPAKNAQAGSGEPRLVLSCRPYGRRPEVVEVVTPGAIPVGIKVGSAERVSDTDRCSVPRRPPCHVAGSAAADVGDGRGHIDHFTVRDKGRDAGFVAADELDAILHNRANGNGARFTPPGRMPLLGAASRPLLVPGTVAP